MLRERNLGIAYPERTFATVDHIVPTRDLDRPFADEMAEHMMAAVEKNTAEFGIPLFDLHDERQGIVHVIGPELGLTQPGMTIACGDSHTATHGAFGAIAFGIGTSQVRDVLATQCLAMDPLKVRRIEVCGTLAEGVYAKDVILNIIRNLGVKGARAMRTNMRARRLRAWTWKRACPCATCPLRAARVRVMSIPTKRLIAICKAAHTRLWARRLTARFRGGIRWRLTRMPITTTSIDSTALPSNPP